MTINKGGIMTKVKTIQLEDMMIMREKILIIMYAC